MKKRMNKKGMEVSQNIIVFLVLNIIFFSFMFIFVARSGTGAGIKEEIYAKQLALVMDQLRPGTELKINLSEVYETAEENKYTGRPIDINNVQGKITVRLVRGEGYTHYFFTKLNHVSLDEGNKLLEVRA